MARDRHVKENKKRFTTRETALLVSLLVVIAIYAYANYFFLPMLDRINQLKLDNSTLEVEYDTRSMVIAQNDELIDKLEENRRVLDEFKSKYYGTTDQEYFIKILELELLGNNDLNVSNLAFNEVLPTDAFNSGEERIVPLHSSVVTFPFEGDYASLIELIRRLESSQHLIRINALNIAQITQSNDEENEDVNTPASNDELIYQGSITIEFFIIPQDTQSPWAGGLPEYDKAHTFDGSLFSFDDGGVIPPVVVEETVNGGNSNNNDEDNTEIPGNNDDDGNSTDSDDAENPVVDDDEENPSEVDENPTAYSDYIVKPGDTLWGISMRFYGTNNYVDQIMFLNNISDAKSFKSGSTIKLPTKK